MSPVISPRKPKLSSHAVHAARNNEQLELRVQHALNGTGQAPLRQVRLTSDNGRVVLNGSVPTYYLKQLAQATAMSIEGVRSLENNLAVR